MLAVVFTDFSAGASSPTARFFSSLELVPSRQASRLCAPPPNAQAGACRPLALFSFCLVSLRLALADIFLLSPDRWILELFGPRCGLLPSACPDGAEFSWAHASSGAEQHKPSAMQRKRKNMGNFLSMFFPLRQACPFCKAHRAGRVASGSRCLQDALQTRSGGSAVRRLPRRLSVSGIMPLHPLYYSDLAAGAPVFPPACCCNSFSVFTTGKLGLVPGSFQPPPRAMHTLTTLSSLSRSDVASCSSAAKS